MAIGISAGNVRAGISPRRQEVRTRQVEKLHHRGSRRTRGKRPDRASELWPAGSNYICSE